MEREKEQIRHAWEVTECFPRRGFVFRVQYSAKNEEKQAVLIGWRS